MKSFSKIPTRTSTKKSNSIRGAHLAAQRRSPLSRIAKTTKRYGKQTLRDLLLSKTFNSSFKVFFGLLVAGSALYGAYAFMGNTIVNDVVVSETEIIARVAKHIELPEGEPEAIVRVQDAERLKSQAPLYESVKEGDYILVYPSLAVVYDLHNDHVVAMKSIRK